MYPSRTRKWKNDLTAASLRATEEVAYSRSFMCIRYLTRTFLLTLFQAVMGVGKDCKNATNWVRSF